MAPNGQVVDGHSTPYVAAWPASDVLADRRAHIRVSGAAHHAKHTRGLVARAICTAQPSEDCGRPR